MKSWRLSDAAEGLWATTSWGWRLVGGDYRRRHELGAAPEREELRRAAIRALAGVGPETEEQQRALYAEQHRAEHCTAGGRYTDEQLASQNIRLRRLGPDRWVSSEGRVYRAVELPTSPGPSVSVGALGGGKTKRLRDDNDSNWTGSKDGKESLGLSEHEEAVYFAGSEDEYGSAGWTPKGEPSRLVPLDDLRTALTRLTAKQRFVVERRFALNGDGEHYTQQELADVMGVTQKAVDRIQQRALRRLEITIVIPDDAELAVAA